jgi:branched-chain amino acid transport system permease protein
VTLVVNGLIVGCIYGIIALGLVLVYKGSRVVNFAQGDFGMVGAFVLFSLYAEHHLPVGLAVAAALAVAALLGAATEVLVVRHLVERSPVIAFVGTLGVSVFLQLVAEEVFDPGLRFFPPLVSGRPLRIGGLFVTRGQLLAVAVAVVVTLLTYLLYTHSPLGLRMRAVAQNPVGAALMGVNVRAVSTLTWAAGGLLSGVAAVLIAPLVTFQLLFMFFLLARALAAAIVGGLTSLVGGFAAGLLLGLAESAVTRYVSVQGGVEVGLLGLVLVALLLRPRGLFRSEY